MVKSVLVAGLLLPQPTNRAEKISNHYELKDRDLFQCEEREKVDVWDGHTPQDVLTRLTAYLTQKENNE